MPRKYDKEQVTQQLLLHLNSGGEKVWARAAKALGMPTTSLKDLVGGEWPDGDDGIDAVELEGVGAIVRALRGGPKTRLQLADILDCGPSTVQSLLEAMKDSDIYHLEEQYDHVIIPKAPIYRPRIDYIFPGGMEVKLGHASDLHFGSIHHQNSALTHFAKTCGEKGVKYIFVSGDITSGQKVYRGQEMETYAFGADAQVNAVVAGLPEEEGVIWLLQGGNHDESHYKIAGTNVVRRICDIREDCIYVGYTKSDIPLMEGRKARLWHPRGGAPYAKSYRGQKGAEDATKDWLTQAVNENEVSSIVLLQWGHVHYKDLFWHGPMLILNPGCFESQSTYLASGALTPEIGGCITITTLSKDGWGSRSQIEWLHYRAVEDDYQPMPRATSLHVEAKIEPLFVYKEET